MSRKTVYVGLMTCDHVDMFGQVLSRGSTDPDKVAEYALELMETWEIDEGLVAKCREQLKTCGGPPCFHLDTDDQCVYVQFEVVPVILGEDNDDDDDEADTDPENIYGSATMRQSVEEDRK